MLSKGHIPDFAVLDSSIHEQLSELYSSIGHTSFLQTSSFCRLYFCVVSRVKLLDLIYDELLEKFKDIEVSSVYDFVFRKVALERSRIDSAAPYFLDGVDSTPWTSHESLLRSSGSFGSMDDAFAVLLKEIYYVKSVYEAFGELRFVDVARLDIYNTTDHLRLQVFKDFRKYLRENPERVVRDGYGVTRIPAEKDEAAKELIKAQYKSRAAQWTQRVLNEMRLAHENGWYIVFDTLSLDDGWVRRFYEDKHCLRDYFRNIKRCVMAAEGVPVKSTGFDGYKYYCTPEYGSKEGRLHFHVVHLMRTLPSDARDPNLNVMKRTKREIHCLKKYWQYGFTSPIAVRYSGDAFTRDGWFWPQDSSGKAILSKPWQAVAYYVTKYVTKKVELDIKSNKHLNDFESNKSSDKWSLRCKKLLSYIPKHNFKVRASRGFGLAVDSMTHLSSSDLIQLMQLPFEATPIPKILSHSAKRELARRLKRHVSICDIVQIRPDSVNLLQLVRQLRKSTGSMMLALKVIDSYRQILSAAELSDSVISYLVRSRVHASCFSSGRVVCYGSK